MEGSRAALVSITRRSGSIIIAEYLRLVSVIQEGSFFHKYPNIPWTVGEIEHGSRAPSEAQWIDSEQEWCLT
jgi:hypothetical protein